MDSKEIWDNVVKNQVLLEKCKRHVFSIDMNPDKKFMKRWKCENCNGEVMNTDKLWYEEGLKHAQ